MPEISASAPGGRPEPDDAEGPRGTSVICPDAAAAFRCYTSIISIVKPCIVIQFLNGGHPNGHLIPEENILMKIHVFVPTFLPPPRVFYCHN